MRMCIISRGNEGVGYFTWALLSTCRPIHFQVFLVGFLAYSSMSFVRLYVVIYVLPVVVYVLMFLVCKWKSY